MGALGAFASSTVVRRMGGLDRNRIATRECYDRCVRRHTTSWTSVMAIATASSVLFAQHTSRSRSHPCPSGMASIDGRFCIDRYEGSLVEIVDHRHRRPWNPYVTPGEGVRIAAESRGGVVPQGYMSQTQSTAACAAAGKRLCTESEWVAACRGPQSTTFPYGNTRVHGRCNDHGISPVLQVFAPARDVFHESQMNDRRLNTLPHTLARTGRYRHCTNAFGVYDMVGNLHEWIDAHAGSHGVFRGGFYEDTHENGDGCQYATRAHSPNYHDYSTGFRCCRDLRGP